MSLTITIYNISFMQSPESSQFLLQRFPLLFFPLLKQIRFIQRNLKYFRIFKIFLFCNFSSVNRSIIISKSIQGNSGFSKTNLFFLTLQSNSYIIYYMIICKSLFQVMFMLLLLLLLLLQRTFTYLQNRNLDVINAYIKFCGDILQGVGIKQNLKNS